ncbi:unnamed protein product [Acanthoscelides obtectus]|uniref:Uncharacterized protein n=1 Tax=Acanthoscelides obtectus TaxID=200917 RepID=A0A9P0P193_ACAOB|nr:unnamed protein product [Acanthoscelides obtectus]CAK1665868.1 hypothetical protein AOBTE_LOCUS25013 [Acanthoscelides obtectus]
MYWEIYDAWNMSDRCIELPRLRSCLKFYRTYHAPRNRKDSDMSYSGGPRMFSPLTRTGRGQAAWSSNDDKKNNNFVDLGNSSPYFSQDIEKVACTCRPVKDQQTTSNRESDEDQAALTQLK